MLLLGKLAHNLIGIRVRINAMLARSFLKLALLPTLLRQRLRPPKAGR